ncbi:MAG: hypothetical protein RLZZ532_1108 [Cyanobacteriota bacterium]
MLGTFQHSSLRIEVNAKEADIRDSLLRPSQLQKWLWPQQFNPGLPEQFQPGLTFTTSLGPVTIQHYVDVSQPNCLRLLLSQLGTISFRRNIYITLKFSSNSQFNPVTRVFS